MWCYRSSPVWLNLCQCDVTDHHQFDSVSVNVMLQIIINLTQSLSVWCYRASITSICQYDVTDHPSSISVSVMLQIIHHQHLSVSCYRSSIINLCQCHVTDHPSSLCVSVMLQIIHLQFLSVSCYWSSIISLCQCNATDHPSSISLIVMLHIIHHQSLLVWWLRLTQFKEQIRPHMHISILFSSRCDFVYSSQLTEERGARTIYFNLQRPVSHLGPTIRKEKKTATTVTRVNP